MNNKRYTLPERLSLDFVEIIKKEARQTPDAPGVVAGWNLSFLHRCAFAHVLSGEDARECRNAVEAGIKDALAHKNRIRGAS